MQTFAAPSTPATAPHFRHKTVAALLAFFLGWAGAHWWYLGRRRAWLPLAFSAIVLAIVAASKSPFYEQAVYYLFLVPLVAGLVEAIVLCLLADERFDARYNAAHTRRSHNRWAPVILAMLFLLGGMSVVMGHVVVASLWMIDALGA